METGKKAFPSWALFALTSVITSVIFVMTVIYFTPRVVMEIARHRLTGVESVTDQGKAPMNHISHTHRTPTASIEHRVIVRMNVDTFYSSGWFDLEKGPFVIHVPETDGRYYSLQFIDSYTNAFAFIGKRTTGSGEGYFFLTGPGWKGQPPENMKEIKAPTNLVWVIGRTMFHDRKDVEYVKKIQSGITFTPIDDFHPERI